MWNTKPAETLTCITERENRNNVFTVAVQSNDNVVGHIPRKISCICMLFIRGILNCLITGSRRYSRHFPEGASYQEVYIVGAWNVHDDIFAMPKSYVKFMKISCLWKFPPIRYMIILYICEWLTDKYISLVRSSDKNTRACYLGDLDCSG